MNDHKYNHLKYTHLKLELDTQKQHFTFGDIRSRFEGFQYLLEEVDYNPHIDILYSVGDADQPDAFHAAHAQQSMAAFSDDETSVLS